MSIGRICTREVVVAIADESVLAVARRMQEHGAGSVVVVDAQRRPIGIVTSRDLVQRCVAGGANPDVLTVSEVMTTPVRTVRDDVAIEDALDTMTQYTLRRLPIVDASGALAGIIAFVDVIGLVAQEARAVTANWKAP